MRATFRGLTLTIALTLLCSPALAGGPYLYAGDNQSDTLYRIDRTTGTTISTTTVTMNGSFIYSMKGLTAEPGTGTLYAIVIQDPQPPAGDGGPDPSLFKLATVAPDTGIATEIGPLGDKFAGLAFAPPTSPPPTPTPTATATPTPLPMPTPSAISPRRRSVASTKGAPSMALYGVTGDGALISETLYAIDTGNASTTFIMSLGNGSDGEAIAYNPVDGMLYHLSGKVLGQPPEGIEPVFEKINLSTFVITPVPLSGVPVDNGNGLVWDSAASAFLFSAQGALPGSGDGPGIYRLYSLTAAGVAADLGPTDAFFSGLAFSDLVPVELMSFTIE